MITSNDLRKELDEIRAELRQLGQGAGAAMADAHGPLHQQMTELNRLVQHMLENAEEAVAEHPVATVAGALALGIVIGRMTAR